METDFEKGGTALGHITTMSQDAARQARRRKWLIGSLTCFIIVAIISLSVGLSVGLSVRNSK